MAKKTKTKNSGKPRQRRERRFEPQTTTSPTVVYVVGAIGAMAMGAGAWEELAPLVREGGPEPLKYALYLLAAGALMVAAAIWVGTTSEPALRVGDSGLALEKGGLRRMPWYAVERIEWREEAVRISGKDDSGADMAIVARLASHPFAAAWIVKEARERVPKVVDVPEDATLPTPLASGASAGDTVTLDPPQVVGRRCAASNKVIAYEPDARLCPRCDRVYHRTSVPETCECGAALSALRTVAVTTA